MAEVGEVVDFDDAAGWGTIEGPTGRLPFHCTQIADGTRTIPVGATVTFEVHPGGMGRWEARAVMRTGDDPRPTEGQG